MEEVVAGLNERQKWAVTSSATVLQVLAPPGSGKTKTLTSRVAYLIHHEGLKPWNIIVCTFTRKAAGEMKERIRKFVGEDLEKKLILGTFHSICVRYLRRYGHYIGLDQFSVLDKQESKGFVRRLVKKYKFNIAPDTAAKRISAQKAQFVWKLTSAEKKPKSVESQELEELQQLYQEELEKCHCLDYEDLLIKAHQLFEEHPECGANIQAVLIDEFQDTNRVQYELMRLFAAKMAGDGSTAKITIVGDPDQSIYSFRNVELENLNRMQTDYKGTQVVLLEENYRSSACILKAADKIIEQDTSRPSKPMQSTRGFGHAPILHKHPYYEKEARWIVDEVRRLHDMSGGLLNYDDFAILVRTTSTGDGIQPLLASHGIPYRVVGGKKFFERKEVRILVDYMRVIAQPLNSEAVLRVINVPARGIGDKTLEGILEAVENQPPGMKRTLWDLLCELSKGTSPLAPKLNLSRAAQYNLDIFVNIILTLQKKLESLVDEDDTLEKLLEALVAKLNFRKYVEEHLVEIKKDKKAEENKSKDDKELEKEQLEMRLANIEELKAQARTIFTASYDESSAEELPTVDGVEQHAAKGPQAALSAWLGNIALATKDDDREGQPTLTISTIHSAKGLEWPIVFIPAAYDGSIPHSRSVDEDEERRLLYVAMTRAKALLYLSWSKQSRPPPGEAGYTTMETAREEKRTLSKFLKHSGVSEMFAKNGPTIDEALIKEIAEILGRECPSEEQLFDVFLKVNQREEKEEYSNFEDPEATNGKRNEKLAGLSYYEQVENPHLHAQRLHKARYENRQSSLKPSRANVFITGTTMSGFTSAASLVREHGSTFNEPKKSSKSKPVPKQGQRGLSAYGFSSKQTQSLNSTENKDSAGSHNCMPTSQDFYAVQGHKTIEQEANTVMKENIKHRIRNQPLGAKRPRAVYESEVCEKHLLLSSSPIEENDENNYQEPNDPNEAAADEIVRAIDTNLQQPGEQMGYTGFVSARGSTVFHRTTMDMMYSTRTLGKGGTSNGVKRFRYGVNSR